MQKQAKIGSKVKLKTAKFFKECSGEIKDVWSDDASHTRYLIYSELNGISRYITVDEMDIEVLIQ